MAGYAPKSLSSASSVDIGSARTTTDVTPERVRQRVHSRMTATPHLFGFDMICECDGLAEADEHVRTARRYIYEQERLIERLADEGRILMTPSASSTF